MKNLLLIVVILCCSASFSQQTLKGKVKTYLDKNESEPLFGVEVYLTNSNIGDVTDDKGNFSINGEIQLPDTLILRASGH